MRARILFVALTTILLSACGSSEKAATSGWGGQEVDEARVLARHKAAAYKALSKVHAYKAKGKTRKMEKALDEAMGHVRALSKVIGEDEEMRELYRSVIAAYESHYGPVDTLQTEYGDVFELRDQMFESLNELEEPLAEDVATPEVPRPAETIPRITNRLVDQSIHFLQKNPEKHVYRWMERSGKYFPMIETILREEGVPDEIKYLATIESGLNPRARSRVGAGGLWQFMPATGRAYGLDVSSSIDERSDPEKSTRAAARHLRDLHDSFDDWLLALAAYNCGPSRVRRAVNRFERDHDRKAGFWDIYQELPRETRNYVPMYLAARMVMSEPSSFGLASVEALPAYEYDVVDVKGPMDLALAAELAGTSVEGLRELNPEILQSMLPAATYRLRIPRGAARAFTAAYASLPESERTGGVEHRVVRGENLTRIARRYGTTVAALRAHNNISGSIIRPGDMLIVPVTSSARGTNSPPVMMAAYRSSGPSAPSAPSPGAATHTVKNGENLTRIAQRYGVSVSSLKAWNDLTSDRIHPGQRLSVRGSSGSDRKGWFNYEVGRGDTLSSIANRYDTSAADLRKWNALSSDVIRPGQKLAIYAR